MPTTGIVKSEVIAETGGHTAGMQAAVKSNVSFKESASRAANEAGVLQSSLNKLKSGAGRGSELDEIGKTLRGAGAVAGLTLMGEAVKGVAEQAAKLSAEFKAGQIDAAGIGIKLAEGIPVVGNFVTAGQSIRELFTGEKAEIDAINADIKAGEELMQGQIHTMKMVNAAEAEIAERVRQTNNERLKAMALTPKQVKDADAAAKASDETAKNLADLKKFTDDRKVEYDKDVANAKAANKTRRIDLEKDAYRALSFKEKHLFNGDNDYVKNAKAKADAQSDMTLISQLAAFKKRMDDDVAKHRGELDKDAKDRLKTDYIAEGTEKERKKLEEVGKSVLGFFEDVAKAGDAVNKATERNADEIAQKQAERINKVKGELADLQRQADQSGMSEGQKRADDLKRDGASAADQALAAKLAAQIDGAEKFKQDQEEAKRLIEQSLTPLQKFQTEAERIKRLLAEGLITEAQADAETRKAGKSLHDADHEAAKKAPTLERRFTLTLPKDPQIKSDADRQIQAALDANKMAAAGWSNLSDIWRIVTGNQSPFLPVGFN